MDKKEIPLLPESSGCYLYEDESGKVIYVGKAKNLKKRVESYFLNKDLDSKTKALIKNIHKIDFIATDSEVEALLLENNLIKKHTPKYNINLKDSKSYSVIGLTSEKFPRLIASRTERIKNKKFESEVFGPFTSGKTRDYLLETLNKTFRIRTCRSLPKKKCIRYDLGICSAPCINKISEEEYLENIRKAKLVLKGKGSELINALEGKMEKASEKKDYEKALVLRDEIRAVNSLSEKQNVERNKIYDEDILNYLRKGEKIYLMIFNINKGSLENKRSFEFDFKEDFLEEFLIQFYGENKIPKKVIIPEKVPSSINEFLTKKKGSKSQVIFSKKGELKELLNLILKNIEIQYFGDIRKVEDLKFVLNLQSSPKVIECFDISHLSGTEVVASMVQFQNGKPYKSNYRKFKIKSFEGNDDFRAMNEVVRRRYSKLKINKEPMPDLVVIDGGKGQLSSSIKALDEIEVKVPIISLAKREEEIYLPDGRVLKLDNKNKGLLFLREIRDEAHRFVLKFQRERRTKRFFDKS
ncbi:MAG: excinuclease ABC subunit UvrC [Nanoarchaeota archaeon]|nr:excinuclease ABC subunit UvrC [Nanoarchaeota archaeon]